MTETTVVDLLRRHTSVREYGEEPVSEDMRRQILDAVFAASSSCFLQLVTVIRVTDAQIRRALYEASGNQSQVLSAPEFWVFCADYHRNEALGGPADLGWTEQLVTATLDVGICAQNAMIALESLGLGGCFIGGMRNHIEDADKVLGLPRRVYPVLGLAFGHPARKNELKPRLPQSVTVMENGYAQADAQVMREYDARMKAYYAGRSTNRSNRTWTGEIGKVLGRERRPFMMPYLRSKGFLEK